MVCASIITVSIVKDWPFPLNKLQILSFLGFANYFKKFIHGFAALMYPLRRLSTDSVRFVWDAECQESFDWVKHAGCNAPVLALPDLTQWFEVVCDACADRIGAVLLQEGRPIAFDGKALTDAESRYRIGEQELPAVAHALELWRLPGSTVLGKQTMLILCAD